MDCDADDFLGFVGTVKSTVTVTILTITRYTLN